MSSPHEFVIIGGGLAGLAASVRLAELGQPSTVIEAGSYPAHKVCGEFFSPESLPILDRWKMTPATSIDSIELIHAKGKTSFSLDPPARSASHYIFDEALATYAQSLGVNLINGVRVEELQSGSPLHLSNGTTMTPRKVFVGAGRLFAKAKSFPYVGYKAHFSGVELGSQLQMHVLKGGYAGISPIGQDQVNVACLAKKGTTPDLAELITGKQEFDWMETPIPPFGMRKTPNWSDTFFIGDAMGSIPPISGLGLTMAILGGVLAAEFALFGTPGGYKKAWEKRFGAQIFWAKALHHALLNSTGSYTLAQTCRLFPKLPKLLFDLTRPTF